MTIAMIEKMLKYLYTTCAIRGPKRKSAKPSAKKRPPRPTIEAKIKVGRSILKSPALIVKTLYGIGVNAAVKIAKKALSLKSVPTYSTLS